MKKTLITLLIAAGALVAAVFVAPGFIDWNAYKGEIAQRVAEATGRTLEIGGDIRLSLLPTPTLSVRDARLSNAQGAAEPDMVRLKELDVTVAFWPLLERKIAVRSVTLVEPLLVVEVLSDGSLNWESLGRRGAPAEGGRRGDGFAGNVRFDDVQIRRGTILYRDAAGRSERLENLDARVVANSLSGPFQVQGTLAWRGAPLTGELIFGPTVEGMAVPLRASVGMEGSDATLRLAGTVGSLLSLNVRTEGSDLARVADALGGGSTVVPGVLAQPFALRSVIESAPAGGYALSGIEAQLGNTRATGSANLRLKPTPDVALTLAVNRLDLDAWMHAAPAPAPAPRQAKGRRAAPAAPPPAGKPAPLLPADLTGRFDLSVEGVAYNGGLVRQLRVEAALGGGTLNLDRVSALLPGGADVVAAGTVAAAEGVPSLDLRLEANADNLRGLLEWLKVNVGEVPADRLRKASFAARVQGRSDKVEVTGIDLRIDTSRLTGGIAYVDRGRPAFGVRLEVDRLVLDPYLAAFHGPAQPPRRPPAKGEAANGPMPPMVQRLLRDVDANLDLTVSQLTVRDVPVQALHVDATANAGTLTVREASVGDLAGLTGKLAGQVSGLDPLRIAHLTFTAEAESLTGLPRLVRWPAGAPAPERLGPVKAQGRLAGDLDKLTVEVNAAAAGGTLDAGGTVAEVQRAPKAELKVRAAHPELGRLTALFADGSAPPRALGALDLYAEVTGAGQGLALSNLQGIVAGTSVRGQAQVDLAAKPRVTAEVQTGDLDLDRLTDVPAPPRRPGAPAGPAAPASVADDSLDLGWLRGFDGRFGLTSAAILVKGTRIEQPALRATLDGGVLTLEQLDGGVLGGQVGATGRLAAPAEGAPQAELNLTLVKAKLAEAFGGGPVDIAGGTLDLDMALTTAGGSRQAMMRALSGKGTLHARDGVVRGFDLGVLGERLGRIDRPQDLLPAVMRSLQDGETRFARVDGTFAIEHGVARTDDTRLIADVGEATATGQVSLPAQTIDMRVRLAARADTPLPPVSLRLTGPLDKPTRSFEMQELQEFLARRAAGGIVDKVIPGGLPVPVPGGANPQDVIRGLLDGLKR